LEGQRLALDSRGFKRSEDRFGIVANELVTSGIDAVVAADIVQAQEARIAAFERLVAKLALEKGFLKKPRDAVRILMPNSVGLAFTLPDAFDLGHMQQVNFAAALTPTPGQAHGRYCSSNRMS